MTAPRAFAMVGLGLAIAGGVGTAVVRYLSPAPIVGAFGFGDATMVGYVIQSLTWTSIGALLVLRRPKNAVGWLMVAVGVGYALLATADGAIRPTSVAVWLRPAADSQKSPVS